MRCMACNTVGMASGEEKLDRRVAAAKWLKSARERGGYRTAREFADALGVERYQLSNWETGRSTVPDDEAELIANTLGLDLIEVRRNLGLWVPADTGPAPEPRRRTGPTAELLRRLDEDPELAEMMMRLVQRASRPAPSDDSSGNDRPATG